MFEGEMSNIFSTLEGEFERKREDVPLAKVGDLVSDLNFFSHAVRAMTAQTVVRLRKTTRKISKTWKHKQQDKTNKKHQTPTKPNNPKKFEIDAGETVKRSEVASLLAPLRCAPP